MSAAQHETLEALKKLRMDLTNAQIKLGEVMRQVAGFELPDEAPKPDAVTKLGRMVTNGSLTDPVHLEAELRAHEINGEQADQLRQRIETTA